MPDAAIVEPPGDAESPPALVAWLAENVPGFRGPATMRQITGGQSNPTFKVNAASGAYILRRKPLGQLLPSAHAVEREFRVLRALRHQGIPVPAAHALCEDPEIAGATFYVMDFVPGRVFWDPRLPELTPAERGQIYADMNRTIADIHRLDPHAIGLGD
ncbi:MAG TPA: phosphotransferase family protein, partial [Devosia sp.]|nr:phosphotransferase family protein [Devosia sp.]